MLNKILIFFSDQLSNILLTVLPVSSWVTWPPALCSCSLGGPSPAPPTCRRGAAAPRARTGRATGGHRPPTACPAWRGCWRRGPSPTASPPHLDHRGLSTPTSPCCPSSWGPAWACGGSATCGGRSTLRCVVDSGWPHTGLCGGCTGASSPWWR